LPVLGLTLSCCKNQAGAVRWGCVSCARLTSLTACARLLLHRVLVAAAVERLQDSKAVVRGLTLKMLRRLMAAVRPQPVLDLLAARGGGHGSWRVREEVVNAHIMVGGQVARWPGLLSQVQLVTTGGLSANLPLGMSRQCTRIAPVAKMYIKRNEAHAAILTFLLTCPFQRCANVPKEACSTS
jgi:hypothetical protein